MRYFFLDDKKIARSEGEKAIAVILASSDWHLRPGEGVPRFVREFLKLGEGIKMVLVGDIFDFLPYGMKGWCGVEGRKTLSEFRELVCGLDIEIVAGNHDPYPCLRKILPPEFKIYRRLRIGSWLFVHGHQRSDWFLWRYIAPGIVEWAVEFSPPAWLWLMERFGWAGRRRDMLTPKEQERFSVLTQAVQSAWLKYAEKEKVNVVIGHTHKFLIAKWLRFDGTVGFLIDCGDLRDGFCVRIDGEPEVIRLG